MDIKQIIQNDPISGCTVDRIVMSHSGIYRREHFHEEVEVVAVSEGEILCIVNGDEIKLGEDNILVIDSRVVHRLMYCNKPSNIVYLQIDIRNAISELFPDMALLSCFLSRDLKKYSLFSSQGEMGEIVSSICREIDRRESFYGVSVKGSIYRLIAMMSRARMLGSGQELLAQKSFKRILPALEYANENFASRITLDEMCGEMNIDKYNFCKQFKGATGITFFDYLGYLRLRRAEELLISTDKNVTEISLECGFSSLQYFNRFFSERTGYSPTAYRKMLGEG